MPELKCHVTNCASNKNGYCCRSDITIDGENAKYVADTCCNSFVEKSSGEMSNCTCFSKENSSLNVQCDATNCVHNNNCSCNAPCVCIDGCNACQKGETQCSSFKAE